MFHIEPHDSETGLLRQDRLRINVKTSGDNLPLKANWDERYCTLPEDFAQQFHSVYGFAIRDDDVFVVTFPKSGTTWMQEAVWLMLNKLDYETAQRVDLDKRSTFLDYSGLYAKFPVDSIGNANALKSPRLIKSHLPAPLLPRELWHKKTKIVYCARNYKDVAVSMYHFHKGLGTWFGEIDEYVEDFINADVMYTPYWPHFLEFWQMRDEPNVFFTTYEDMTRDLKAVLSGLREFLEQPPLSDVQLERLAEHLSFTKMKENIRVNKTGLIKDIHSTNIRPDFEFMRRGITGAYKDELTPELQIKLDEWAKRCLQQYKLTPDELCIDF